jgi:hypothetical protein
MCHRPVSPSNHPPLGLPSHNRSLNYVRNRRRKVDPLNLNPRTEVPLPACRQPSHEWLLRRFSYDTIIKLPLVILPRAAASR